MESIEVAAKRFLKYVDFIDVALLLVYSAIGDSRYRTTQTTCMCRKLYCFKWDTLE